MGQAEANAQREGHVSVDGSSSTLLFNIGIDVFSCLVTVIVYGSCRKDLSDSYDCRLLRHLEIALLAIILTDLIAWLVNGRSGEAFRILSYSCNILYFLILAFIDIAWIRYVWIRLFSRTMKPKIEVIAVFVPLAVLCLVVVSSPFTGLCFYLDDANVFHRGVLSTPIYVIAMGYTVSVSVIAACRIKKEVLPDRRSELRGIALFALPPLLGGIMQMVFYGMNLVWPCAIISFLLIVLGRESLAVSRDSLTGLNNRRSMERYLGSFVGAEGRSRTVALFVMDINDFKSINDRYGHDSGDKALLKAADLLRARFSGTPAFLARYGGDEFIAVLPDIGTDEADRMVRKVKDGFDDIRMTEDTPFQISVSVGYALSEAGDNVRMPDLFKMADSRMYEDKIRYHAEQLAKSADIR